MVLSRLEYSDYFQTDNNGNVGCGLFDGASQMAGQANGQMICLEREEEAGAGGGVDTGGWRLQRVQFGPC